MNIIKNYINLTNRNNTYIEFCVNIGINSIVYSKMFSKVIAFEPDIYNYSQSKENIIINNINNIELHNKGLGSEYKKISTKRHYNNLQRCTYIIEIECITLDSMNLNNIDYIKINVEGYELNVLKIIYQL